jgi:flavin reductase (DIM6/NTAB) family NADH-FMN oxidoreductase RutF
VDSAAASALLGQLDPALWLVTARAGPRRGGLVATFVSQASIVPAASRMLVGVARQHFTWDLIDASRAFALHLLGEDNLDWVWRFGLQSGREVDKFDGLAWTAGATASPLLAGSLGWLDCKVEDRLNTGDRTIFLGEVVDARLSRTAPVLTATRMLERASADQRRQLKDLMTRDSAVDAEGIRAWRSLIASRRQEK